MKLPLSYYQGEDVVYIARDLIGKFLYTKINNRITAGIISETEAYAGATDRASHAYGGLRTNRTEVLYQNGGISYIYLCYGIHHLFNIVTGPVNTPHAVLIRGIIPYEGKNEMASRIREKRITDKCTNGPGKLSKTLGITTKFNCESMDGSRIWIEERDIEIKSNDILISERIGVGYAKEDTLLPYRFNLGKENLIKQKKRLIK